MDLVKLTEFLVKSIVKKADVVSVKQYDDEEEFITIDVVVDNEDMGALIGKSGNIATSIRTIVQTSAYLNLEKKVRVNFDSF